ncbi:MAG TPA: ferredoxin family protein [Burkholderiales bacterium]|nr:ferredoxin family protein [Burkholderiales bacterium]
MNDPTECRQEPGRFQPVIDRNRCEGRQACVAVCPYGVFVLGTLSREDRAGLTLRGKLKGFVHRWQQAFATNADACHACGLCVAACPEDAITLARKR